MWIYIQQTLLLRKQSIVYITMLILTILVSAGYALAYVEYDLNEAEVLFENFIIDYKNNYENDEEKQMRFNVFKQRLQVINEVNMQHDCDVMGLNFFADLSEKELQRYLGYVPKKSDGNIESQYAIKHGADKLMPLSEQQVVDGDNNNDSCFGGDMGTAILTLMNATGVMSEEDYPYTAYKQPTCNLDENKVKVKVIGCLDFTRASEEEIKAIIVKHGPLSIGLAGNPIVLYSGGVFSKCNPKAKMNHALLLVGYGTDEKTKQPYWIIKNSWGNWWGEGGYIRMIRGNPDCKIGTDELVTSIVA